MSLAAIPQNEAERLQALKRYQLLDTAPEDAFEQMTRLARNLFNVPIALISIVDKDRQWFKSASGISASETCRKHAFCAHAILQDDTFVVNDALEDDRFRENPLVTSDPYIRFYAGAQLVTHEGFPLGTLCIIDQKPRMFFDEDLSLLRSLADLVTNEIELRSATGNQLEEKCFLNRDEITGAYNRRAFKKLLRSECARSRRHKESMSLAILALDAPAKAIRDTDANAEQALIKYVHSILKSQLRSVDIVARISNSKFAIIFPSSARPKAEIALRRTLKTLSQELKLNFCDDAKITVGLSHQEYDQGHRELFGDVIKQLKQAKNAEFCLNDGHQSDENRVGIIV